MLQEGRVGHHGQIRAVQFEAHVDLLGDAGQQLRQGLVDGVQGDVAGNAGVNVDIDLGIAGQGKQQVAHRDVVDDHAVGFGLAGRAWLGQGQGLLDGRRNAAGCGKRGVVAVQVPFSGSRGVGPCRRRSGGRQAMYRCIRFSSVWPCLSGDGRMLFDYRQDASTLRRPAASFVPGGG
jgi:hypothetical protein